MASNSVCYKCKGGPTKKTIKKIVATLKKKTYPQRKSNERRTKELQYFRICPGCKKEIGYVRERARDRANKQNAVCNSCSSRIYKKSWQYVIKDEHIKKMSATKAGYNTFSDYMKDLDKKKKYYREVRRITREQDISILENYDKLRGLCGVDGAYQLDHIIPVSRGYEQGIPAKTIGCIDNLQIIPWRDNLLKSNM